MSAQKIHILLAEDDTNLSFLVKKNLEEEGYIVHAYTDGVESWNAFNDHSFGLCILDIMLPRQDGFTLAQMIRKKYPSLPILFLTARTLKEDVYQGFELGADDYITKPFTLRELLLRIRAVLRRSGLSQTEPASIFKLGKLTFNYHERTIAVASSQKTLSTKENELLRLFAENRNMVINRKRLLIDVWGNDDYFVSKSLDVYITRLRKLLAADPDISIQNYHSLGYKLIIKNELTDTIGR